MREIRLRVANERREELFAVLDEYGIDYVVTEDARPEHFESVVSFPVSKGAVDPLFDDLEAEGFADDTYLVATETSFASSSTLDRLKQEYNVDVTSRSLPRGELRGKVEGLTWPWTLYHLGTVLSTIVATAGLLLDSPALVLGAMVIAPQVSTAIATSVGTLLADWDLLVSGAKREWLGLTLGVLSAALFAWVTRASGFVPPTLDVTGIELVGLRLAPNFLTTAAAVAAGVAGAFGFMTEQSTSLVGVMIAAAIIPAAAAVGIGIAWALPIVVLGAALLLVVNVLAINGSVFVTLWSLGYYPDWQERDRRPTIPGAERPAVFVVGLLFAVLILTAGGLTYQQLAFERTANQEVHRTLESTEYRGLELEATRYQYAGLDSIPVDRSVTVDVSRPAGGSYPDLSDRLERRIEERTGVEVTVRIRFSSEYDTSTAAAALAPAATVGSPSTAGAPVSPA